MMLTAGWLRRGFSILSIAGVMVFITEQEAYAYTDPGSGALIWQMLLAASFGAVFYVRKLLAWFGLGKKNRSQNKKKDEKIVSDE